MTQTAARLLAATLDAHGVDLVYCVPGESFLAVTDALIEYPHIRMIVCRHEAGAGFMTVTDGQIRGRPGVCFVSRGPGACNAGIALHAADHDAVPAVFFVGHVDRPTMGRRALQDVNYPKAFSDSAKMVIEVVSGDQVAEAAARAFHIAESGTPGPVVVVLPEDALEDETDAPVLGPRPLPLSAPAPAEAARAAEMIRAAARPVVIAGSGLKGKEALALLTRFAEAWSLPVLPTHRRANAFDAGHPNYAGYLANRSPKELIAALRESDLVIGLGERFSETVTQGYVFPRAPKPEQPLIHVWPDASEIGRVFEPALGLGCDPQAFLEALGALSPGRAPAGRKAWIARLNEIYRRVARYQPALANDGVVFGSVVEAVRKRLPRTAAVTSDAGNFMSWIHRHLGFTQDNLFLGCTVGAMGMGVPAAVAAGLREPGREVVCFVGDGGMLMTGNELATALQFGARIKIFVANNSSYGTIRLHQENRYPGRVAATALKNPDFALLGEAFGARGLRIENEADVEPVVAEAMAERRSVVVDVRTSLSYLNCWTRLDEMPAYRGAAGASQAATRAP
ncbi:MAG: acetolactate synthase [Proteobacteria bacterium]|nr:acetolactate synthase [Pseudomonadota bacterium]